MLMLVENLDYHFFIKTWCFIKFQAKKEFSKKQKFFDDSSRFNDQLYDMNKNSSRIVPVV